MHKCPGVSRYVFSSVKAKISKSKEKLKVFEGILIVIVIGILIIIVK